MEQLPTQESAQLKLRQSLISEEIAPRDFIDALFDLDQSTPSRTDAITNLSILEEPTVMEMLTTADTKSEYFNLLSITHFHIGQLSAESDNQLALIHFEAALKAANLIDLADFTDWERYIEATVAYFKLDMQSLQIFASQIQEQRNREVAENLLLGLKERGSIDYNTDYAK